MIPSISKYIAELYDNKEVIVVYGNFAIYKKSLNLPQHIVNQLTKEDLVLHILKVGVWKNPQEINGYNVYEITVGDGRMLVATNTDEIRFIIGV